MPSDNAGFFSDPKVMISILALVVSGVSFLWSLSNQNEQNRRWNSLNAASMEFTRPWFQTFREITRAEFESTNWGYRTTLHGTETSADKMVQINSLVIRDTTTGAVVPHTSPCFTMDQIRTEIRRVGFAGNFVVTKLYRPIFYFKNNGKTEAMDVIVSIDIKDAQGNWAVCAHPSRPQKFNAGQEGNILTEYELPLEILPPERLSFRINFEFTDINNVRRKRSTNTTWISMRNYWVNE